MLSSKKRPGNTSLIRWITSIWRVMLASRLVKLTSCQLRSFSIKSLELANSFSPAPKSMCTCKKAEGKKLISTYRTWLNVGLEYEEIPQFFTQCLQNYRSYQSPPHRKFEIEALKEWLEFDLEFDCVLGDKFFTQYKNLGFSK